MDGEGLINYRSRIKWFGGIFIFYGISAAAIAMYSMFFPFLKYSTSQVSFKEYVTIIYQKMPVGTIYVITGIIISIILAILGIGIVLLKKRARRTMIFFLILDIILLLIIYFVGIIFKEKLPFPARDLVINSAAIYFFTRPKVKEQL